MKQWINRLLNRNREPAHLATGRWGERQAEQLLKKKRYKIMERRLRVGKHDELDLVAEQGDTLVFVEVKTRSSERFGRPFAAVNAAKRKRISRAGVAYLRRKNLKPSYLRFDVVEIIGSPDGAKPEVRHIENAFPLDSSYRLWW